MIRPDLQLRAVESLAKDTDEQFLMFVTLHRERPDWLRSDALDTERFEMHVVLVRKSPEGVPVVVVSSVTRKREAEIMALLTGASDAFRPASPDLMRRFLSVAQIGNILHLGTRNTGGGSQARTYTTNSGRAVEDGMTYEDLRDDVVGHVGALCHIDGNDYNGGVSIGHSRLWIIKQFPIDGYIDFVSKLLDAMGAGQPGEIRRLAARFEGVLTAWPENTEPVAIALDEYFLTSVQDVGGLNPIDTDIRARPPEDGLLPIEIPSLGWSARLRTNGTFAQEVNQVGVDTAAGPADLLELLTEHPPIVYFRDGTTTRGARLVPPSPGLARPPLHDILDRTWDWSATDITRETRRPGSTDSIHEKVEAVLQHEYANAWLLGDDGSGEIADHIVVEPPAGDDRLVIHLFHSKASSEVAPGLRTGDFDELLGQLVRSKRWVGLADRAFWRRLAERVLNRPSMQVLSGPDGWSVHTFRDSCRDWSETPPIVSLSFVGVQPGLNVQRLLELFDAQDVQSTRLAESIGACAAWVGNANSSVKIIGS